MKKKEDKNGTGKAMLLICPSVSVSQASLQFGISSGNWMVTISAENEKPGDHLQLVAGSRQATRWDDQVPGRPSEKHWGVVVLTTGSGARLPWARPPALSTLITSVTSAQ